MDQSRIGKVVPPVLVDIVIQIDQFPARMQISSLEVRRALEPVS
jgi:hypothetical protein